MTTWWHFGGLGKDKEEDDYLGWGSDVSTGKSIYGRKYKSSLGWSSSKLTDTTSYYSGRSWSSYYNSGDGKSEVDKNEREKLVLMAKAYKAVRDMIIILDFPFSVDIKLANYTGKHSSEKNRVLLVPSKIIDYPDYSDDEKINILCGNGVHEAAHLKYTEYRVYKNFVKTLDTVCDESSLAKKYIANLIEDTRVEDKLLSERPGYLNLIEDSNNFKYKILKDKVSTFSDDYKDIIKFIFNVIKFIRFPDKVDSDTIKTYKDQFIKIQEVLSESPQFTKDSCLLGSKIYECLSTILALDLKSNKTILHKFIQHICPDNSFEIKVGYDEKTKNDLFGSEVSDLFNTHKTKSFLFSEIISGDVELGDDLDVYFEKPKGDDWKYNLYKKDIARYVPGIRKLIQGTDKNYDFTIHGCREGMLDTNKLAEAYQGVSQVYVKKGKVSTNKTTVCILIDQSGSMGGVKETLAMKSAILLNEALKDLPGVDLYIYGHSADMKIYGDTVLYIYREGKKYCPKYSLSSAIAYRENRDGTAILETAKRVRKHTKENCIMFVLSDGEPAASRYSGYSAKMDVKSKVKTVEKMGFNVIQVSIDYVGDANLMFDNVVCLNYDISNLPKRLSQIIKRAIVKDKQVTVS